MINKKETYIVICKKHKEMLIRDNIISTPELLTCKECETPFTTGIRCYPKNKHNPL